MHVGAYEILGEIGRGGMGSVLRARAPDGRIVAVKVLITPSPERLARFDREKRLIGEFGEAEGFVPLLDAGVEGTRPYLVMPFCPGGTLRARVDRGALSVDETVALGIALARAAGRAHARGIVHRDLKPENVLYTATGKPLVADLGLAKHFETDSSGARQSVLLSRPGEMRGTVGYMAPEQLEDAKSAGPPADVFALGAILQECLTGQPVFSGENALVVMQKIMDGTPTPIETGGGEVPRWLGEALRRALATDPQGRFPDGEAFAVALSERRAAPRSKVPLVALVLLSLVGAVAGGSLLAHRAAVAPSEEAPLAAAFATLRTGDPERVAGAQRTVLALARGPEASGTAAALDAALAATPGALELHRVRTLVARARSTPLAADDLAALASGSTAHDADDLALHGVRFGLDGPRAREAARALHAAHKESSAAAELHGLVLLLSGDPETRDEAALALRSSRGGTARAQELSRALEFIDNTCVELARTDEPPGRAGTALAAARRAADALRVAAREKDPAPVWRVLLDPFMVVVRREWHRYPLGDPGAQWRMEAAKVVLGAAPEILPPALFALNEFMKKDYSDVKSLEAQRDWIMRLDGAARLLAESDPLIAAKAFEMAGTHAWRWFGPPGNADMTAFAFDRYAQAVTIATKLQARAVTDNDVLCAGFVRHECERGVADLLEADSRDLEPEARARAVEAAMVHRRATLELARTVPGLTHLVEDDAAYVVRLALLIERPDEVSDLFGQLPEQRALRAELLRRKGDSEGAIALASGGIAAIPHKGLMPESLAVMARAASDLGRFDEARGYVERLLVAEREQKIISDWFRSGPVSSYLAAKMAAKTGPETQASPPGSR